MSEALDQEFDRVLHLDPQHPCYKHWKQYHANDLARGSYVSEFLSSQFSLRYMTVLDIGSGLGGISLGLARESRKVIGVEASEEFVKFSRKRATEMGISNVEFLCENAEELSLPNSSADLVIMNDVIEHFADPPRAIAQAARSLKAGGHVYVLAPNRNSLSVTLCDPHYKLPFVVWMPQSWRDFCVRLLGRGDHYDGNWFPSIRSLIEVFSDAGIELKAVGFFEYERPRIKHISFANLIVKGYPVYLGTKL